MENRSKESMEREYDNTMRTVGVMRGCLWGCSIVGLIFVIMIFVMLISEIV